MREYSKNNCRLSIRLTLVTKEWLLLMNIKLYPAEKVNVFDVVGAGDTFLAALTYGYLKYGRIEEAIPLANKAAAVAVSHRGTYVLTEEDVKKILC